MIDENGKSILDKLYVDLLPDNIILNKCLLDNTTFLIGRRGTGKSTIFLKLENEYRKKNYLPCYVDVKTIYESSQAQAINQQYLQEYLNGKNLSTYFIERPFNYTKIILQQISEIKIIKCKGCGRVFNENEKVGLEFTGYKCPSCHDDVEEITKIDDAVVNDLKRASELPRISKDELTILMELNNRTNYVQAKEFAGDVDINSHRLGKICKKMDEDKGLVFRKMDVTPYEYKISEQGKKYLRNNGDDSNSYL